VGRGAVNEATGCGGVNGRHRGKLHTRRNYKARYTNIRFNTQGGQAKKSAVT